MANASSAIATWRTCRSAASPIPKIESHMKGYANTSRNPPTSTPGKPRKTANPSCCIVEGPRDPPGFYFYQVDKKNIEIIGVVRKALSDTVRPRSTVISYLARDGKELSGYLTAPAGSDPQGKLPLVLMPHGGPGSSRLARVQPLGPVPGRARLRGIPAELPGLGRLRTQVRRKRIWRVGPQDAGRPHRRA